MASAPDRFDIAGSAVGPGERARFDIDLARLPTGDWLSVPTIVLNGARAGPRLWLDAAIHGDELNGMEIIHDLLSRLDAESLRGTLIAVPIVNVFGLIQQTRYLPDRRDLNRCFPGNSKGSLASRIAHFFMTEVVSRCDYGIDFHTGSQHRTNLPQIRADLSEPETRRLAQAFAAPLMYQPARIDGSLRAAAAEAGARILVYEAGEPLRFDPSVIRIGVEGTLRVLAAVGMIESPPEAVSASPADTFEAGATRWLRAERGGVFHLHAELGALVDEGQLVGHISDPAGADAVEVVAPSAGMVMGFTNNPLVHQGDALMHIAAAAEGDRN